LSLRENANIPKPASDFVAKMIHLALENPHKFAENLEVQKLVRERELRLKQKRSRFMNPEALKEWKSPGFGGQLNYRWRIAESYLSDIAVALESGN
jgi:hypothetical protein